MRTVFLAPLVAAVAAAAAIPFIPAAGAGAETLECQGASASLCGKPSPASADADSRNWPFRAGHNPPVWVLE